ncbi:Spc98 family-domain-containing protein [Absidia repens]|uniref:Spindle pole body component n=1 Tax=Absidia repens TaxID=90262 RepID=A0A1X2IT44_9FUNG|nr:Spc98 family-domain-containing protein [Absidia repens]
MTQTTVEHLLQQLIENVTGINESSRTSRSNLQHIQATLKHHRSSSTEEHLVDETYANLADKFLIKGYGDLADDLTTSKNDYLDKLKDSTTPQRILAYDMLSLLLALSDSPMKNTHERKQQIVDQKQHTFKNWGDVLRDEPLKGSHWQNWDDIASEDDDDDDDDYWNDGLDDTSSRYSQIPRQQDIQPSSFDRHSDNIYLQRLKAVHTTVSETSATYRLNHLKEKQYWDPSNGDSVESEFRPDDSILHDSSHLNIALHENTYNSTYSKRRIYIKEADAIREVLFLLCGYKTVIFKPAKNDNGNLFHLDPNYALRHLSCQSFKAIMDTFCHHACTLYKLRGHVERTVYVRQNGQTYQAFSVAISTALNGFERLVAELESKYMPNFSSDSAGIVSLLQLQETLHQPLSCFGIIYDTLVQCSLLVSATSTKANARSVATFLLATLFNQTLNAQMTGDTVLYQTMLSVFYQTLVPYSRLLDDWIWNGSLNDDVAGELFIKRKTDIDDKSSMYWTDGFFVGGIELNTPKCPLFTAGFTNRILLTGKTVNVINKFNITKRPENTPKQVSLETIFCQQFHPDTTQFWNDIIMNQKIQSPPTPSQTTGTHKKMTNPFIQFGVPALNQQRNIFALTTNTKKIDQQSSDFLSLFEYELNDCLQLYIDDLYDFSAHTLLSTLQRHASISDHLYSLSNIYLMLDTDLMHSFCETLFIQMDKKDRWYDRSFINQAFVDACQISDSQKYMTLVDIKMQTDKTDLNQSRKTSLPRGYKALTTATYLNQIRIDYQICWPTNNFIKPQCLDDYDRLVHLLIRIKRAKYVLEKKTLLDKCTDMAPAINGNQGGLATRLYALRMRMVWFINAFWRYIMTTVLHADTKTFKEQLAKIENADEIPILHELYLKHIIDKCLLNEQSVSIKKAIIHIMDLVEQLADLFTDSQYDTLGSLNTLEKDYIRTSEFIATSLSILGRKGSLAWFDILATSLSV